MAYTPQQWHDDTTSAPYGPISGDRLNYIEAGIQAAAAAADAAGTASGGASLGTALPVIDGSAAAGTSGSAAHEDHVHPTDTSRAALASPTFSGTPSLPTASVAVTQSAADSTTKLATTAFVTTADNLKANLASPTFTGTVSLPSVVAGSPTFSGTVTLGAMAGTPTLPSATIATTQTAADNSTKLATTAYADAAAAARAPASGIAESAVTNLVSDLAAKAPLASPTFTGTATIPNIAGPTTLAGTVTLPSTTIAVTASASDNSTKPATTAYVDTADALKANLASPTFSGTPSLPTGTTGTTQTAADNSTKLATTAYVDAKERAFMFGKAGAIGATETNAADFPFIVPFAATMKRCKVVLGTAASGAMTVQIRKASAPGTAVPSYSDVTGFVATFANGSQIATFTLGTAVAVTEGDLLNFSAATGSGTNMSVQVVAT